MIQVLNNKMTPEQFVYWLQGFMEVAKPETLNKEQVQEIKNHLAEVFHKVTPIVTTTPVNPDPATWPWDKPSTGTKPFNWPPSGEVWVC